LTLHIEKMSIPLLRGVGRERQGDILREVANLVDEGKLRPLIHEQRFSFDEVNEAHALYETKEHNG
jgi:NADPH2:quinone reductase